MVKVAFYCLILSSVVQDALLIPTLCLMGLWVAAKEWREIICYDFS